VSVELKTALKAQRERLTSNSHVGPGEVVGLSVGGGGGVVGLSVGGGDGVVGLRVGGDGLGKDFVMRL
jgi:hypothetical protein